MRLAWAPMAVGSKDDDSPAWGLAKGPVICTGRSGAQNPVEAASLFNCRSRRGIVNLYGWGRTGPAGRARHTESHAMRATPVTSAQVWKAWARAARYWAAGRRWGRRWKRLLIPLWAERKRWACLSDL